MHPTIAQVEKVNKAFDRFTRETDLFLRACRENASPIKKIRVQTEPEQNYRRIALTYRTAP
jgi:hypothetical protein